MKKFITLLVSLFMGITAFAQDAGVGATNADFMRDNGKIYVVVAVLFIILTGVLTYLVMLDRKVKKLEKIAAEL